MADAKISALPAASTPLTGTEVLPVVQSGVTDKVSVANLTAGRAVTAASLTLTTTPLAAGSGGTGTSSAFTANGIVYASSTSVLATGSALTFDGTNLLTTGRATAASFVPSGSSVPTNGMYLSAANTLALATNSAVAVSLGSTGTLGVGTTSLSTSYKLIVRRAADLNFAIGTQGADLSIEATNDAYSANVGMRLYGSAVRLFAAGVQQVLVDTAGTTTTNSATAASFIPSGSTVPTNGMYLPAANTLGWATASTLRITLGSTGLLSVGAGSFGRGAPVTKTGDFTLAATENWVIVNQAGTTTVTLPAASSWTGREVMFKTTQNQTLVSASSNVVPQAGGAAGTAILAGVAGTWATCVSDGTNWIVMQGGGLL